MAHRTFQRVSAVGLLTRTMLSTPLFLAMATAQQAQAQRLVSGCAGVALQRSVVTDIMSPVLTGVTGPTEAAINALLNVPLIGPLLPNLNLNATGLLNQAASGASITLEALATDGTIIGVADQCNLVSDSITLKGPAGVAIGGNKITGLGANNASAFASDINSIAFGNNARAEPGALSSIAIGSASRAAAPNSVALGAASVANRGALIGYSALGLASPQTSAGEVSVGSAGASRQLTNVAAGSAATDAANVGQLAGVSAQVTALSDASVLYDSPTRSRVTLAGAAGTTISNVAAGALSAASTEAVNGAQLFATNQAVTTNTGAITNIDARLTVNTASITDIDTRVTNNTTLLTDLGANAVRYDGPGRGAITLAGATGTKIANVTAATLAADSTEAVNGAQLFATNERVTANTAAIAGINNGSVGVVRYSNAATPTTPNGGTATNDATLAGANAGPVGLHNVRDGSVAAGSTDAVNGGQLYATNQAVARNTGAITNIDARVTVNEVDIANLSTEVTNNSTLITNLGIAIANQPLRYANAATPTTPNGGVASDDATLAGASGGPVGLHNVRAGTVVAGSTDAVNGGQLAATNAQVSSNTIAINNFTNLVVGSGVSPVQYTNPDTPTTPNGGRLSNNVTLVGADRAAPVALHNIAAGSVTATSTDAVNGSQLYATAQVAQQAAALGANSVQYDPGRASVTFNSSGSAVLLRNVAAGTAATDAVNVGQLQSGLQGAVSSANAYTDARLSAALTSMNFNLREVRRDLGAGSSSALAAAALPQATEPGKSMIAMGSGTYGGQAAFAFGASTYLDDGHSIFRVGATIDSQGKGGANAGYGYQF